jgi:hypothetical protein
MIELEHRRMLKEISRWMDEAMFGLMRDSLTPSHDAKDGKVSANPIAPSVQSMAIEPPQVVDEA